MKKVSFVGIVHFMTAIAATLNEKLEWVIQEVEGATLNYKSLKNYKLSQSCILWAENLRNPDRNPFTVSIGRIAALIHANPQLRSVINTVTFTGASTAEKMFSLYLQVSIGENTLNFNLEYIKMGRDSLATAANILNAMIESLAGEDNPLDLVIEREEEKAALLAQILESFKVSQVEAAKQSTGKIKGVVAEAFKTMAASNKLFVKLKGLQNGTAQLQLENKNLKEQIELAMNPAAVAGKKAIAEDKAASEAKATEKVEVEA